MHVQRLPFGPVLDRYARRREVWLNHRERHAALMRDRVDALRAVVPQPAVVEGGDRAILPSELKSVLLDQNMLHKGLISSTFQEGLCPGESQMRSRTGLAPHPTRRRWKPSCEHCNGAIAAAQHRAQSEGPAVTRSW